MPETMDNLSFRPYGSGVCKRCGKETAELLLATLSSDGTSQSMEMCRDCAAVLKKRVDARNARISRQQYAPAPEQDQEPPAKKKNGASGVKIAMLIVVMICLVGCAVLFFLWDRIQPQTDPVETTTNTFIFKQPDVTEPVQPVQSVKRSGDSALICADGFCGIKADGTLASIYDSDFVLDEFVDILYWSDLVAVDYGGGTYYGLQKDGTVLAAGEYVDECDVSGWTDIVAICAEEGFVVGLKADGTVVAAGDNDDGQCNVSDWTDIVAITTGENFTVGLRSNGSLVWTMAGNAEAEMYCPGVSVWTDVAAISANRYDIVALKKDGTVVGTGPDFMDENPYPREVSVWTDIVAISNGRYHTVGLKADGTVVATGQNDNGQCNVSDWTDIAAVSAGYNYTLGLRRDGTIVTTLTGEQGTETDACLQKMSQWTNMMLPEEYR